MMAPRLSSKFGDRYHPIKHAVRHHGGVDLAAPVGAPIRAVADGIVVFSDPYAGYGKLVVITHSNGLTTHYGHCHELRVAPGTRVKAGQIIATVGSTGRSTGPHLHFEVRKNGKALDPMKFLPNLTSPAEG
ncbi:MAG: M23 family metallopeptidase [Bdellovibrionales bacterium]|nr:M23 family metallopeptidase [Bdellovibrionales bacterium]